MSGSDEALRRMLRQLSPDLQQLTVKEVVEMKWVLKRRVILSLFGNASTLTEPLDELHYLCEERQKEMGIEKRAIANGAMTVDERKEAEMLHRTRFLRIVITGLQRVRWPPALEAFSDPLEDLMNDREVFVDAVQYLHRLAVAPSQGVDAYVKRHSQAQPQPQAQPQAQAQAQAHGQGSQQQQQQQQQRSPNTGRSSARGSPGARNAAARPVHHNGNDSSSSGEDDAYSAISHNNAGRDNSVDMSDLSFSKLDLSMTSGAGANGGGGGGAMGTQRSQGMASSRSAGRSNSSPSKGTGNAMPMGDATLRGMIQVLQQQNESLAAQLHSMHTAHSQKEDVEKRVETILVDIVSAVGDVVGSFTGGGGGDGSTKDIISSVVGNQFIADESFVTDEEHDSFQREVDRENTGKLSKNAANKAANLGISQGRSSLGNHANNGSGGSMSNNSHKNSSKRVTSSLIWQQVHQKLQGLHSQWLASRDEARKVVGRSLEEKWRQKKSHDNGNGSSSARKTGRGTDAPDVRRAMGAVPPLWSTSSDRNNSAFSSDQDQVHENGIDTPAVHQLQRDLLDFADAVTAYAKTQGGVDDGWDPAPTTKTAANMQQTTCVLKRRARDLALHLAVHGAVPNFTGFDELQAKPHSTATDRLMQEVEALVSMHGLNKKDPTGWRSILVASEGARNELLTMHSFVRSSDRQQYRQHAAADKLAPLLEQFMKNAQRIMRSSFDPLKPLMDAQLAVIGRLRECESSSIVDKQGNRVKPLDMLSRGYLGENVSELVNALRQHQENFGSMESKLREMHTSLHKSALTELNALDIAKRDVLTTLAETTEGADAVAKEEVRQPRATRPRPAAKPQPSARPPFSAGPSAGTPRSPDAPNWSDRAFEQVNSGGKTSNSSQQKIRRPVSPVNVSQRSLQNRPPFEM